MREPLLSDRIVGVGFLLFGIQFLVFGLVGMYIQLAPQSLQSAAIAPFYQSLGRALGSTLVAPILFIVSIIAGLGWIADGFSRISSGAVDAKRGGSGKPGRLMVFWSGKKVYAVYLSLPDPAKTKAIKVGFCWPCVVLVLLASVLIVGLIGDEFMWLRDYLGAATVAILLMSLAGGSFGNVLRRHGMARADFILLDTIEASSGIEATKRALANSTLSRTRDKALRDG